MSILPDFEYDLFISYRQNDNRSGWVTEFVNSLQQELASTIKEPVSVYFDTNPHDGLLETHNVDKSLEGKLKCLIFIPIISQTYCDPKSFAWQHEFCAFNKLVSAPLSSGEGQGVRPDTFGRDIKLANGNVASRILPVKIHSLDAGDQKTLEKEIGSALRAVEFIYKEPGVNRPLSPDDDPSENLNRTKYRNQVNKVANAIKEIITGLTNLGNPDFYSPSQESLPLATKTSLGKSIVVLPFEDMSPEKDQEYFCDGLAEELINALTKVKDIHVVARMSAFSFKGKEHDVRKIGKKLKVETLMEGSVRKAGNKLRITVQLINVADGFPLWSERYDREVADIFSIQDEIALNIVEKMKISLSGREIKLIVKRHTENIEAYSFCLKGRHFSWLVTSDSQKKALYNFGQAIERDPNYALAYAGLADLYCIMATYSTIHPEEAYKKGKAFAEKALGLDDSLGEAHLSMAFVKFLFERNWQEAENEFRRALELSPGSASVYNGYSLHLMALGDADKAIAVARRSVELDPLSSVANQQLGWIYHALGRFDDSLDQVKKALELDSSLAWSQLVVGWNYGFKGMYDEAIAACRKATELGKTAGAWFHASIACVYAMAGSKNEAKNTLRQVEEVSRTEYVDPFIFAVLYTWLGNPDQAFHWLEKGYCERSILMYCLKNCVDLWFKPIGSDPRMDALLRKMGLASKKLSGSLHSNAGTSQHEKSIAVLPFVNISNDPDQEYFCDGLSEEIINSLTKIKDLHVAARTSAFSFKGKGIDAQEIGKKLGVVTLLEGSVRKAGNQLRITA